MPGPLLHEPTKNQCFGAGWSSPVARQAHNLKVVGSNPTPATNSKGTHSGAWHGFRRVVRIGNLARSLASVAGWSSLAVREAHNLEVSGSNPLTATKRVFGKLVAQRPRVLRCRVGRIAAPGTRVDKTSSSHLTSPTDAAKVVRAVVFISKATPGDDEFVVWLAPRLEEAGYTVFSDILNLEPGDRWRKVITNTLQSRAIKLLLCCRDTTLAKDNVQEEIGIALDLVKELPDPKFIIPLRLEPYKKVLGIGEIQYIDFVRGWAEGLDKLLDSLKRNRKSRATSTHVFASIPTGKSTGGAAAYQ